MKQSCRFAHSGHARAVGQALGAVILLEKIIEGVVPGRIHPRAAGVEHSTEVRRAFVADGADGVGRRLYFGTYDKAVSMTDCDYGAWIPLEFHNLFVRLLRLVHYLASVRFCLTKGLENSTTGRVVGITLEVILLYQVVLEGIV